ncbi:MAG: hypothetical protein FWF85_07905 [Clostridiales bacterium]|nr:hypothetical protein [Clostridiales bacterium]MDR2711502.1 hypothetical protein [Clostridiales bacterium]
MLSGEYLLIMLCPFCHEHILYRHISRFRLQSESFHVRCPCGGEPTSLHSNGKKLQVESFCPFCLEIYRFVFNRDQLGRRFALSLTCHELDVELCCLGHTQAVITSLNQDLGEGEGIREMALAFDHPPLIFQALREVNRLVAEEAIFCECGCRDFNLRLGLDRLRLSCTDCRWGGQVWTALPADLKFWERTGRLVFGKNGLQVQQKNK